VRGPLIRRQWRSETADAPRRWSPRSDGHTGPGGRGEEGCLVPGGSNRAERDHAPGNCAAREKVAQRAATQRDEGQQQAAYDDA
jgi:hypothetical protein